MSFRKQSVLAVILTLAVVVTDQVTKHLALTHLRAHYPVEMIQGLFSLNYVENRGAAWGMLQGNQLFLIAFSVLTLAWLAWRGKKIFLPLWQGPVILALLSGGIIGNLLDRFFRGYVVDFLDFYVKNSHFPAFNVADSCICVGVFLFLAAQWYGELVKKYHQPIDDADHL